jgi:transposase
MSSHLQDRDCVMTAQHSSASQANVPSEWKNFVGIDIAKDKFDVVVLPTAEHRTFDNQPTGHQQFLNWLSARGSCLLILESSGGYERALIYAAQDAGWEVVLANPRQVRDFAKGQGQLAKTDHLDAAILARFGQLVPLRTLEKTPEKRRELEDLIVRRRQLVQMQTAEHNRRQQATRKSVQRSIEKLLQLLERQIQQVEQQITELLNSDDDWKARAALLETMPGIGPANSALLVAELNELGQASKQQIVALVGVAPYARDSGNFRGERRCRGGRQRVRSVLYMAAITAIRCNPQIKAFAQRLRQAGKKFKVVVIACIRKMLVILNSMVKHNQPWNPERI